MRSIDIHAHGPQGVDDLIPQQNWSALSHLGLGVTTVHDPSNAATEVFAAAEYQRAVEEVDREMAYQRAIAERELAEHARAKAAHEKALRQHNAAMAKYKSKVATE